MYYFAVVLSLTCLSLSNSFAAEATHEFKIGHEESPGQFVRIQATKYTAPDDKVRLSYSFSYFDGVEDHQVGRFNHYSADQLERIRQTYRFRIRAAWSVLGLGATALSIVALEQYYSLPAKNEADLNHDGIISEGVETERYNLLRPKGWIMQLGEFLRSVFWQGKAWILGGAAGTSLISFDRETMIQWVNPQYGKRRLTMIELLTDGRDHTLKKRHTSIGSEWLYGRDFHSAAELADYLNSILDVL